MEGFDYRFNKIYVLKSLGDSDTAADDLYYNTIYPCAEKVGLATEFIELFDRKDWDNAIDHICNDEHCYPLIHFEMHGDDVDGLCLRLGDNIPWNELLDDLRRVNIRSEMNLIITMATCYSTMTAFNISMVEKPAPYLFSVTTKGVISTDITYPLYSLFFEKLIETSELYSAFKEVEKIRPDIPNYIDILAVPFLFENVFDETAILYKNGGPIVKQTFNNCYMRYRDIFFMYDKYPHNRDRFNMKQNYWD